MGSGAGVARSRNAPALDVVYVVRPGDDNEELRYSLRSVASNAPHRRVWIVGSVPSWVRDVVAVPLSPLSDKFENQRQSLTAVVADPRVSDPFVLFNDDMFVMERIDGWSTWHLGSIGENEPGFNLTSEWGRAVQSTREWMATQGHPDPLYYENHTPLMYDKQRLESVLAEYPASRPFVVNGTYPITGAGGVGVRGNNAKLAFQGASDLLAALTLGMPYLSTEDESFATQILGEHIRNTFPNPGPYEEAS